MLGLRLPITGCELVRRWRQVLPLLLSMPRGSDGSNSDLTEHVQTDIVMEKGEQLEGTPHVLSARDNPVLRKDRHDVNTPMPRKRWGVHGWARLLADVLGKNHAFW